MIKIIKHAFCKSLSQGCVLAASVNCKTKS
jgi:hypothetical protein